MVSDRPRKAFKKPTVERQVVQDIESLFRSLRRDASIPHLWAHQADTLRAYERAHLDTPNVALELPTGTGKTLIGLLLAEYRRQRFGERVVYLCPTRQLVHQVIAHADKYGVETGELLPKDYPGLSDYQRSSVVGVATYRGLFNTHPKITEAATIILDDAHAAEDYIAGLWAVTIARDEMPQLYRDVVRALRPEFPSWFIRSMLDSKPDPRQRVDVVPAPRVWAHIDELHQLLSEGVEGTDQYFPWSMIQDSLHACALYVSWREILIRPLIPPTQTHRVFAEATQRIYMSATLGAGGELERITGIRSIERLAAPEGWEKETTGRRLFLFPNYRMRPRAVREAVVAALDDSERALILVPNRYEAEIAKRVVAETTLSVLEARDVETSLDTFADAEDVALVLANRYDGVDLPDNTCRVLVMQGLPAGANLQERFLLRVMEAGDLLRDRLRTRFTQGVGRCTRGATDYSTVLVVGQDLFDFCARADVRAGMHPELQAELEFGLTNSADIHSPSDVTDLLEVFFEHEDEWAESDDEIIALRDRLTKTLDPLTSTFHEIARHEVDFQYHLWEKDYESAVESAVRVTDALKGDEVAGYRAWWYYHAGVASFFAADDEDGSATRARDFFRRAAAASSNVPWLASLRRRLGDQRSSSSESEAEALNVEGVFDAIDRMGWSGERFEHQIQAFISDLGNTDADPFERGLQDLGVLLGFDSPSVDGQATPDALWISGESFALVFEAKSDESAGNPISVRTVRQARTHETWARGEGGVAEEATVHTVIVSPRSEIVPEAKTYGEGIYLATPGEVFDLGEDLAEALRRIRSVADSSDLDHAGDIIAGELRDRGLLPEDVLGRLTLRKLQDLPEP